MKDKMKAAIGVVLVSSLAVSVFADSAIKLVMNGQELQSDVAPKNIDNRVMVPIRVVSEAFGADVQWDAKSNSVIIGTKDKAAQELQISLLENALAEKDRMEALNRWAEGVKMRNGALQYAMMSPELKKEAYAGFVEANWSTGVSSPWIESFKVSEKHMINNDAYRFEAEFTYTDSTQSKFIERQFVTVKNYEGNWLIAAIDKVDAKGQVSEITLDEGKKVKSIFIEDKNAGTGSYGQVNVLIGSETKVYKGYTETELTVQDVKQGAKIEVTFKEGPILMIYPAQAEARIIRVME